MKVASALLRKRPQMNIGLYQSAASLSALERWQDVTTQNITAGQVNGYRKRTVEFSGISMGELQADPLKGKIGQGSGPASIFPVASFGINFQTGENFPTKRPLDLALEGEGYFELQIDEDTRGYTRVGAFHISPERQLVTSDGTPVLSAAGTPIKLLPDAGDLAIASDGTITQGSTPLGKLSIQKFPKDVELHPLSGGLFAAKEGVEMTPVEKPLVLQGHLEGSNVTPLREMVALVQIARAYEANQKIITTQDQTLARALETLG
jgi:flagellar basal-body rod protein FlgF